MTVILFVICVRAYMYLVRIACLRYLVSQNVGKLVRFDNTTSLLPEAGPFHVKKYLGFLKKELAAPNCSAALRKYKVG